MRYKSPLRYPGGKGQLANYFKALVLTNELLGGEYVEPYAGGAGVALALLLDGYVSHVHINDFSRPVYAFWHTVLNDTETLCRRVRETRVTIDEYWRQKAVLSAADDMDLPELGFAAFYVNRTSRSGIISSRAGAIGGNGQHGNWRIDARYHPKAIIERIDTIARQRHRIQLYNLDAEVMLLTIVSKLPERTLVYLDPPYYRRGHRLYANFYEPDDHAAIAKRVRCLFQPWVVSYGDVPEIRRLYAGHTHRRYKVMYTAARRYEGVEMLFFSHALVPPRIPNPARFTELALRRWLRSKKCE